MQIRQTRGNSVTAPSRARTTFAGVTLLKTRGLVRITMLSLVSLPPVLNAIMMIGTRIMFAIASFGRQS